MGAKIAVFSDLHANLPALVAGLEDIERQGCDEIIHLGDAVAIGPYPAECLERLYALPDASFVMGNHDDWLAHGLPEPVPEWMSAGEVEHQHWVRAQIRAELRAFVAAWPFQISRDYSGIKVAIQHYALDGTGADFQSIVKRPVAEDLDSQYQGSDAQVVLHGHTHIACDIIGQRRYINPGSLGCYHEPRANYCVLEFHKGQYSVEHRAVGYDDAGLFEDFELREVPERAFLYRAFFGGRFQT